MTTRELRMSASQLKSFEACERRWGYVRIDGLWEPQGTAAARGSAFHKEMEMWSKASVLPTSKQACAALPYTPAPGIGEAEVPVSYSLTSGPFIGYIDLVYDWEGSAEHGKAVPLGSTGTTVIHDFKFTGNLRNALPADVLEQDVAACVYAYEAYLGGAQVVWGRWVYVQMNGSPTVREVWFNLPLENVVKVLAKADRVAKRAQALYRLPVVTSSLPQNTKSCYSYGQRCPHLDYCNPPSSVTMPGAKAMSPEFKSAMTASFPTAPAAPKAPPLPPKLPKAPSVPTIDNPKVSDAEAAEADALIAAVNPALAGFLGEQRPTPESGIINSPEAPATAVATNDEAIAQQGVKPAPEPTVDDLDGMTDDQIKGIGVALGAFPTSSKMRRAGRIGAIRAKRLELGTSSLQAQADADQAGLLGTPGQADACTDVQVVPPAEKSATIDDVVAKLAAVFKGPSQFEKDITAQKRRELAAAKVYEAFPERDVTFGLGTLYINCAPGEGNAITLGHLLEGLRETIKTATGAEDYRLVEFGKGPGAVAVILREFLADNRISKLVVDTRTQEGLSFVSVLQGLAEGTVRGF